MAFSEISNLEIHKIDAGHYVNPCGILIMTSYSVIVLFSCRKNVVISEGKLKAHTRTKKKENCETHISHSNSWHVEFANVRHFFNKIVFELDLKYRIHLTRSYCIN